MQVPILFYSVSGDKVAGPFLDQETALQVFETIETGILWVSWKDPVTGDKRMRELDTKFNGVSEGETFDELEGDLDVPW